MRDNTRELHLSCVSHRPDGVAFPVLTPSVVDELDWWRRHDMDTSPVDSLCNGPVMKSFEVSFVIILKTVERAVDLQVICGAMTLRRRHRDSGLVRSKQKYRSVRQHISNIEVP